jgi:hypothetical protein
VSAERIQVAVQMAKCWARWYTLTAVILSAILNGYACGVHESGITVFGMLFGATVPCCVWMLAQVTAWTYRAGWTRLALFPGAVSTTLLILSVTHCASAFAALTATDWRLSICLAVGIDCGLVSSELVAILISTE